MVGGLRVFGNHPLTLVLLKENPITLSGVSISTDVGGRVSATSIRDVGYFLLKLKELKNDPFQKIKIDFDVLFTSISRSRSRLIAHSA